LAEEDVDLTNETSTIDELLGDEDKEAELSMPASPESDLYAADADSDTADVGNSTGSSPADGHLPGYHSRLARDDPLTYLVPNLLPTADDKRVRYYEVHAIEDDLNNYNDAKSTRLRQHDVEANRPVPPGLPVMIPPAGISVIPIIPDDYPTRLHTETIYHGIYDNHPPRYREMDLIHSNDAAYHSLQGSDEHAIAKEFQMAMAEMMVAEAVYPDDPAYLRAKDRIRRGTDFERQRPRLRPPSPLQSLRLTSFENNASQLQAIPEQDEIRNNISEFLGMEEDGQEEVSVKEEEDDDYDEDIALSYWTPHMAHAPTMRRNQWVPNIDTLRCIRRHINTGIRFIARMLLTLEWRNRIDRHKGDTRHYFYRHCHIFRYLQEHGQLLFQGFYARCIHIDYLMHTPTLRQPLRPINPLLTTDEDEFLTQAANAFELEERGELANIIRVFRAQALPHDAAVRMLFDALYVDPVAFTDCHGARRPIVWRPTDL
jgi:hypothetical protein